MGTEERLERARLLYERAVFGGDADALADADRELDAVEAALALARGRIIHGRSLRDRDENPHELVLFEQAARLFQTLGDVRGEAESLLWVGLFHQVIRHDEAAAVPALRRSLELATRVDDKLTISYVLRHLAVADHTAGRTEAARAQLEESVRLRRELGFLPGVAANLVGLAHLAVDEGRRDDALALIEEADSIARASDAHGILRHVEQARTRL